MQNIFKSKTLYKPIASIVRNYASNVKKKCGRTFLDKFVVTLVGGDFKVAHHTALLLKQHRVIDEIRLFNESDKICGIAYDLSHIDSSPQIRAYYGHLQLRDAIEGATMVVCSGQHHADSDTVEAVFAANADFVRNVAIHTAEFNPKTVLCVSTPPCTCMIPMITEEYKKARVYDPRKIVGLMNVHSCRGCVIAANQAKTDPTNSILSVVGGDCDKCIVAVYSRIDPKMDFAHPIIVEIQTKLEDAQHEALFQHLGDDKCGHNELDVAYATTRFISMFAKALKGKGDCMESAFVRQTGKIGELSPYLCTPILVSTDGIESCYLPPLSNYECEKLKAACEHMVKYIQLGESYVTGKVFRETRMFPRMSDDCSVVEMGPAPGYEKYRELFEPPVNSIIEVYHG